MQWVRTAAALLALLVAVRARAITGIEHEEDVSDLLVTHPDEPEDEERAEGRRWAVLPQVGGACPAVFAGRPGSGITRTG